MALYTSSKDRFVGGALVKAGAAFELPEGQKPSADMTQIGGESKPERKARGKQPDTLSEMAEATKLDPVA